MRKYALGVLILFVVLLVNGQEGCQRTGGEGDLGTGPYVGGNDGLNIEFLDDAPPLGGNFQGDPIPIEVELINNGEQEVPNGAATVSLIGSIVGGAFVDSATVPKPITSASATNSGEFDKIRDSGDVPDSVFVSLGSAALSDSEPIGPSWSPNIRAQVCYPYATYVQIDDLCIPGERRETGSTECEVDNAENLVSKGDVSAAPLQVSSLIESRTGDGIRVKLDIENQGGGTVVTTSRLCSATTAVTLAERDLVHVSVPTGYNCVFKDGATGDGTTPMNAGTVELRNDKGRLRCTKTLGSTAGRSYLDRFTATLTYNYIEETAKTILIESEAT